MTIIRSTRTLSVEKRQCPICFEQYFDRLSNGDEVVPIRMACQHTFCRSCIEIHWTKEIKCPLPWCQKPFSVQPDSCEPCASWVRSHCTSLVVLVRANEMSQTIDTALNELADENDHFRLAETYRRKLLSHVRTALSQFEWQYHSGAALAELLDPFLLAVNPAAKVKQMGTRLRAPAPNPSMFPPRPDPNDYPNGDEPWVRSEQTQHFYKLLD